nr:hypothetical protein [Tanacetum cinerariifolium]
MASLADKAILSGADNRPPMLEKDMYDSWKSIMELYMLNRVTRLKKYSELSAAEAIQADCDVKATNIILQGLPPEVNTKFLNILPSEWSKFVTDVKLVRDLHTTNVDQLHAYLGQHEYHANECTFPTEGMRSIISMVSISLEGFLPFILLLVVVVVAIVIVAAILVVVVIDAIVGVVIVVVSIGVVVVVGVSFIIKLLLVIIGACLGFLFILPVFSMLAAYASRAVATWSSISCRMAA